MRGHTLERLQTRTMPTGDLDSSFDDRSRDVATGEPQLGSPQIRGVSPMESIAELPVQAILDSSAHTYVSSLCLVHNCIVNGPGEMADADYGYVGRAGGKIALYRGRE